MKRPKAGRPALPDRWFPGFSSPNFTSVPDEVFDLLLSVLTEAELKVLLYIIRRTFGFKKSADSISIRQMTRGIRTATGQQLDSGTGLSVPSVTKAVKSLERQGIIVAIRSSSKERGSETTTYALNLRPAANPDLKLLRPSSKNTLDPPLNSLDPQDSGVQKTEEQQPHATASPVAVSSLSSPTKPSSTKQHRALGHQTSLADQAYKQLLDFGVHPRTANSLLKSHGPERILQLAEHLRNKLASGWLPRESPAAWLVAAIRDNYNTGQQPAPVAATPTAPAQPTHQTPGDDPALHGRLMEERRKLLKALGIAEHVDALWRDVLRKLKSAGTGSPLLAACLLRQSGEDHYELILPWASIRKRVEPHLGAIERCLSAYTGHGCRIALLVSHSEAGLTDPDGA